MVSSFLVRGVDVASETESEPDGHGRYGRSLAVFEQVGQSVVAVDVEAVETRPGGDTRIEWIHVHAVSLLLRKLYLRMAAYAHVDLFTVDIGVASDITVDGVINRKIAYGTKNMAKGPAMTYEEAIRSIEVGIDMVKQLKEEGYQIICTGEMGVGNTTPCSAMASLLLDVPVRSVTGRGSGLTNEGLEKKTKILERILEFHKDDINLEDPIDILAKVGGFEIGGMAGLYIGGAAFGMPVVADGVISCVAALLATRIDKRVRDYIMPSHISEEPAAKLILDALDFKPFLTCGMHLGEGTGAVALMPLFDMALDVYHNMSTFNSMDIMVYEPYLDEEEK